MLTSCFVFSVRLVGSPLAHAGFVQIRQHGRWGSFCDWSWELTQGHVVCRELGYRRALYTTIGELFEQQFRGPIWVEEAVCDGNESSIFNCDLKYIWDYEDVMACDHSHSAGVICESNHDPRLNGKLMVGFLSFMNYSVLAAIRRLSGGIILL